MESDAVPTSSVLFGTDGTQLPEPLPVLPDALTGPEHSAPEHSAPEHSAWPHTPEMWPASLPPLPDGRAMREAIAAVLADDPAAHATGGVRHLPARPASGAVPRRPLIPVPSAPAGPPRATHLPSRADLRRRSDQESAGRLQSRSSGGVRTAIIIALIIIGVVAFNIIAAIVQAVSALFS